MLDQLLVLLAFHLCVSQFIEPINNPCISRHDAAVVICGQEGPFYRTHTLLVTSQFEQPFTPQICLFLTINNVINVSQAVSYMYKDTQVRTKTRALMKSADRWHTLFNICTGSMSTLKVKVNCQPITKSAFNFNYHSQFYG